MITAKLDAYVYALADPRIQGDFTDRVFYIGKGRGNRCFNHAHIERERKEQPLDEREHKLGTIREIRGEGKDVDVFIVRHGMTDQEAHALEAVLIPLLGGSNKVAGHGDQLLWLTRNEIAERYDRPIERRDIALFHGNLLFVSLNRQDTGRLTQPGAEADLARLTLGDWNLSEHRSRMVDCIVGVKYGLVVSIFKTHKSEDHIALFDRYPGQKKGAHGRSRFHAETMPELEKELRGRSVFEGEKMMSKIRRSAGCEFYPAME